MKMSLDLTRAQVADMLGDLLQDEKQDWKTTDLWDKPRDRMPKAQSKWAVRGITLVYVQHHCLGCDAIHTHTSPRILLNMEYVSAEGEILKKVQTMNPLKMDLSEEAYSEAQNNMSTEYLRGEDTDYCISCVESLTYLHFKAVFKDQQKKLEVKANGVRMERMNAIERATKKLKGDKKVNVQTELQQLLESADEVQTESEVQTQPQSEEGK
jgi:hypothetical protein